MGDIWKHCSSIKEHGKHQINMEPYYKISEAVDSKSHNLFSVNFLFENQCQG